MNINRSRRKERSGGTHKVGLRCAAANKLRCDLILKRTYIMTILPAAIFPQSSQSTIHHIALLRSPLYKLPSLNTLREVCKLGMVTFCKWGLPNNRGAQNWSLTRITALDWTGCRWLFLVNHFIVGSCCNKSFCIGGRNLAKLRDISHFFAAFDKMLSVDGFVKIISTARCKLHYLDDNYCSTPVIYKYTYS